MEVRLMLRRGESVLVTLIVPVLLLVFLATVGPGFVAGGLAGSSAGEPLIASLLPGLLALAVMSAAMVSLGIATAFERQYGVLKRLGGSPLPRPVLLAAKILSILLIEMVQVSLLGGVAAALGWRPGGNLPLAITALALGTAAFGGLGLWMAGSWRAEATLAGANGLYLVFLLLGGIVVPVSRLPEPLGVVAGFLPSAALTESLRSALLPSAGTPLRPFAALCIWALLTPTVAALTFRWE